MTSQLFDPATAVLCLLEEGRGYGIPDPASDNDAWCEYVSTVFRARDLNSTAFGEGLVCLEEMIGSKKDRRIPCRVFGKGYFDDLDIPESCGHDYDEGTDEGCDCRVRCVFTAGPPTWEEGEPWADPAAALPFYLKTLRPLRPEFDQFVAWIAEGCVNGTSTKNCVYFVVAEDSSSTSVMCKIGYTASSMYQRLASLRTGSATALKLGLIIIGDSRLERAIHTQFKAHREHGEWFRFDQDTWSSIVDGSFLVTSEGR